MGWKERREIRGLVDPCARGNHVREGIICGGAQPTVPGTERTQPESNDIMSLSLEDPRLWGYMGIFACGIRGYEFTTFSF